MTIDIIKNWENIGGNYLDSNLEITENFSNKLSFEETLRKTIELLPTRIKDIKALSQAIYEISLRDYKTKNHPKDDPLTSYDKLLNEITVRLDKKSLRQWKKALNSPVLTEKEIEQANDSQKEKLFRNKIFFNQKIIRDITLGRKHHGLVYSIENQKGCISHIIGTLHLSHSLLVGTKIPQIVENCHQLFTEVGLEPFIFSENDKNRMDSALTILAFNQGIPIDALDEKNGTEWVRDLIEERIKKEISSWTPEDWARKSASYMKKILTRGEKNQFDEYYSNSGLLWNGMRIYAWESGDSRLFNSFIRLNKEISVCKQKRSLLSLSRTSKIRNQLWLEKLLPALKNTEYPIAIAVGSGHLFGKKGLLKSFASNGFTVEQIL